VKRLLVTIVVLAALFVAADRLAVHVAEGRLASAVASAQGAATDPTVTIRGFPFLTQAFGGEYDDIQITGRSLVRGDLTADRVTAELRGVQLSLGDALAGRVGLVPARSASVTALLLWDELENASGQAVQMSAAAGGGVRVVTVVSGRQLTFVCEPSVQRGQLVLVPRDVAGRTVRIGSPRLPFRMALSRTHVTATGIEVTASGRDVALTAR
jgi:hypothetical protein